MEHWKGSQLAKCSAQCSRIIKIRESTVASYVNEEQALKFTQLLSSG